MSVNQALSNVSAPIVTTPINNIVVRANAAHTTLNLINYFDDPYTTGLVANFQLSNTSIGNGGINVVLFDQNGLGAPKTVQNFQNYVNSGSYSNTIIHRSAPEFVIQGGGFTVNNLTVGIVPSNAPVENEFSTQRSNVRGTIAMAKLGNDPNSATNQWFFNLNDNSSNLNNQNGGFTVFGQAISNNDLGTIDAIASIPTYDGTQVNPAFTDLPLIVENPAQPVVNQDDNFIRYSNITISQRDELNFTILGNSKPDLVTPTINGNQLSLNYFPNQSGTTDISIRATNLLGEFVDSRFSVTVLPSANSKDFNNDGKTDILLTNPSQGWNTAWLMDSTNYVGFSNIFGSPGYKPVATADFNQDGKTDLVVNNPTNNFNSVWFLDGGNYTNGVGLPTAAGWQIKGAADFNSDGNVDVLLNNTTTNWNTVWFLGGANGTSYTGYGNLPVANGWNIAGVADFNSDGKPDILLNNPTQGWNSVWFLDGTNYSGYANLPSAPGWQSLGTGDFNNDGNPDLILNNINSNWNTVWLMNGTNYAGFANLPTAPAGWQIAGMA
jgi:cyclophilin family peptidyl-prolyl cis-trans isomerase